MHKAKLPLLYFILVLSGGLCFNHTAANTQDTLNAKYFPLAVGNVYKYQVYPIGSPSYFYKIRITKDTIISSKRYFALGSSLVRYDSASANVYQRYWNEYCPYSPFEKLLDSLRARKYDTTSVCYPSYKKICLDTATLNVFGYSIKTKSFRIDFIEGYVSVIYGYNLGMIFKTENDYFSTAYTSLVGCYVNGVLYGDTILTDIEKIGSSIPDNYNLRQNYPNPFNPVTRIKFEIPRAGDIKLAVFDVLGREITTLVNEELQAGVYETAWDGSAFPSGVYFYRLISEDFSDIKKMILLK